MDSRPGMNSQFRRCIDLRRFSADGEEPSAEAFSFRFMDEESCKSSIDEGLELHHAGRLEEARTSYQAALRKNDRDVNALTLLGVLAFGGGHFEEAIDLIGRAVMERPESGNCHFHLGEAHRLSGNHERAIEEYRKAAELDPSNAAALDSLGVELAHLGRLEEATGYFRQAISADWSYCEAYENLGVCLARQGFLQEALKVCKKATHIEPQRAEAHTRLAAIFAVLGYYNDAAVAYARASTIRKDWATPQVGLAQMLARLDRYQEAASCTFRALKQWPGVSELHYIWGVTCNARGAPVEAANAFREAIRLNPSHSEAYSNLGEVLLQQLRHADAAEAHRTAMELRPDAVGFCSNLLLGFNYRDDINETEVFNTHLTTVTSRIKSQAGSWLPSASAADKRLRVGYVSPDLRNHPVPVFLAPILQSHDLSICEPVIYADVVKPDDVTARIRGLGFEWHETGRLNHQQFAARVIRDQIDILVDLAGHTGRNRLSSFALAPAPVQVTYLGYPNTTGLPRAVMQYRITDAICDPPGESEQFYTEDLARLDGCFLCYGPPAEAPEVVAPPVTTNGFITFGSFNGMPKITRSQISLWAQVLKRVPNSKMLLKNKSLGDPEMRELLYAAFSEHGIERDRLELSPSESSIRGHLARYGEMDIALDTYPYNGTTTTCEALWMGVPVISLQGRVHRSRVGASILTAVGQREWIAQAPEQYLQLAISLSASVERLSIHRSLLRDEMLKSDLTNASKFTRGFEAKLRSLWKRACTQTGS